MYKPLNIETPKFTADQIAEAREKSFGENAGQTIAAHTVGKYTIKLVATRHSEPAVFIADTLQLSPDTNLPKVVRILNAESYNNLTSI